MTAEFILEELLSIKNPEKADFLKGFFKTGKGHYAEGDCFFGITVPLLRNIAKTNKETPLPEIEKLLYSEYHEARFVAALLLMEHFKKAKTRPERKLVFDFYLRHTKQMNNWDLVDVSCREIVGGYLLKEDKAVLFRLAESENLWEQRIAIVSTWMFIKHKDFDPTFALSEKLITHKHDLIHKAMGWMLREVGKKDRLSLKNFLDKNAVQMPRTALRYSIEHFSPEERNYYMTLK